MVARRIGVVVFGITALAVSARADCIPIGRPGLAERQVASLLCRTFRDVGAVKATVSLAKGALDMSIHFDDPQSITFWRTNEAAKTGATDLFDNLPPVYKAQKRVPPRSMRFSVWSTDLTDVLPRVIWSRKQPGAPLERILTDGIVGREK